MGAARSCCDSNNISKDSGEAMRSSARQRPGGGSSGRTPARRGLRACTEGQAFPRPASADRRRACARQCRDSGRPHRPSSPSERLLQPREPVPPEVLQFQPSSPAHLTFSAVARSLCETKRGSAPGLSGARAEHYKLLLQWGMRMTSNCSRRRQTCWRRLPSRSRSLRA